MKAPSRWSGLLVTATLIVSGLLTACVTAPQRDARLDGAWLIDGRLQSSAMQHSASDGDARTGRSRESATLAIALGGGGMRGYAHIGVLQALEDAGIHPRLVVGTSIGAVIGAAYASGASPEELWKRATTARVRSLADVTLTGPGFVKGDALASWINELVGNQPIELFPSKFAAIATDIDRSMPFVITGGDAGQAARASAAIPGVFLPVWSSGTELIDGGVTSLVPIRAARALGADIVIGVDIYCHGPRYEPGSVLSMWLKVSQTQSCLLSAAELAEADVVIAPSVAPAGIDDVAGREVARRMGYEATRVAIPALRARLEHFVSPGKNALGDRSIRTAYQSGAGGDDLEIVDENTSSRPMPVAEQR